MENTGGKNDGLDNEVKNEGDGVDTIPRLVDERTISPNSHSNLTLEVAVEWAWLGLGCDKSWNLNLEIAPM